MQIVEYGYGNIASKLNGLPNKHEITSLTLKNTVLFHKFSVLTLIVRCKIITIQGINFDSQGYNNYNLVY